jgi:hypothetical protein
MKQFKRIMIMVGGGTVLVLGVAMIVLPGPAFIVIPAGLAILALEFAWARRWLRSARAIMPRHSSGNPTAHKITLKSIHRSVKFLFRRFCQTLHLKRRSV